MLLLILVLFQRMIEWLVGLSKQGGWEQNGNTENINQGNRGSPFKIHFYLKRHKEIQMIHKSEILIWKKDSSK